ncbi:MAG: hypothetical protein FWE35_03805 [Streptosporangiales bacterium]|nr:hypothetical protein [Streptosporangiales bacterium]
MNRKHKPQRSVPRIAAIAGAAVVAAAGSAALGLPAANAATSTTPLPVSFSASSDGASASYNASGDIILTPGTTNSSTFAQVSVNLKSLGDDMAPTTPPSFTTDNYSAGSPRWVIELANGNWIDGYPTQLNNGSANDAFTGNQWAVGNSGTYESYQAALTGANDALGNVQVTDAYIVADGDQIAGTTDTLTNVQYNGDTAAPGPVCSAAATGCSWERLKDPSAMVMDVKGQTPTANTPVIAYGAKAGDPAADFTLTASGTGSSKQIAYTPYGTYAAAKQTDATLAAAAYSSSGAPLYCVSSIADKSGQPAELRSCATSANEWQDFLSVGSGSYRMLEPTYGKAGVSAGSPPMALNDKGFGGNGSPLVNYAAGGSGNEEFTPGT